MNELEEVRSRCDEIFADLTECQEQLRMERAKRDRASELTESADGSSLKRQCLNSSSKQYALALLKLDCQYVYLREYRDV